MLIEKQYSGNELSELKRKTIASDNVDCFPELPVIQLVPKSQQSQWRQTTFYKANTEVWVFPVFHNEVTWKISQIYLRCLFFVVSCSCYAEKGRVFFPVIYFLRDSGHANTEEKECMKNMDYANNVSVYRSSILWVRRGKQNSGCWANIKIIHKWVVNCPVKKVTRSLYEMFEWHNIIQELLTIVCGNFNNITPYIVQKQKEVPTKYYVILIMKYKIKQQIMEAHKTLLSISFILIYLLIYLFLFSHHSY